MSKKIWKNEYEYKRILEILNDYWLTEKDEDTVVVKMYFKHKDGRTQMKHIDWHNFDYTEPIEPNIITLADVIDGNGIECDRCKKMKCNIRSTKFDIGEIEGLESAFLCDDCIREMYEQIKGEQNDE